MKTTIILLGLALHLSLATFSQTAGDLLQQALRKERIEGDLEGAIELYHRILEQHGSDRPLAAQALVLLGKSQETLGQQEARQAYQRVITDYSDQAREVTEARARLRHLDEARPASLSQQPVVSVQKIGEINSMGSPSPDGRYISFVNWTQGNLALYDTHTGEQRDLTSNGTWNGASAFSDISLWSPDGKQIAFFWITGKEADLRIISIHGGPPRVVAPRTAQGVVWPQDWSPDASQIFGVQFQHDPGQSGEDRRIVSVDVSSGLLRVIRELPKECINVCLSVSPDGRHIAYEFPGHHRRNSEIRIVNVDGTGDRVLISHPANDWSPKWSPDGKQLLFLSDRSGQDGLWLAPVRDGEITDAPRLVRAGLESGFVPMGFARDGAFYFGSRKAEVNVYQAGIDWDSPGWLAAPQLLSLRFQGRNRAPFWSPDGARLAYLSQRPGQGTIAVIHDAQTGQQQEIKIPLQRVELPAGFASPLWSSDGQKLILRAMAEEGGRASALYSVHLQNESADLLLDRDTGAKVLTPDGQSLIYVNAPLEENTSNRIVRRHLASGREEEIRATGRYLYSLTLSPDGTTLAYFEGESRGQDQQWATALLTTSLQDGTTRTVWEFRDGRGFSGPAGLDWLPDSRRVLVAIQDEQRKTQQLQVVDTTTGNHKPLGPILEGDARIRHLRIQPNGASVTFSRGADREEVWAMKNFLP
jgi:Tol biopolymer transport system component